jgi:hypothetical protein
MKKYVYIIAAFFIIVTIISISIYDYKKLNQNNYYQNTPDVSLDIQLPVTTTNIWNAINELNQKDSTLETSENTNTELYYKAITDAQGSIVELQPVEVVVSITATTDDPQVTQAPSSEADKIN